MTPEQVKIVELSATVKTLRSRVDTLQRWHEDMIVPPEEEQRSILTHPWARFSPQERAMLGYMLRHAPCTMTREGVLAAASHTFQDRKDGPEIKIIDVRISNIRKKLDLLRRLGVEDVPIIETVRGVGYRARFPRTTDKET